MLYHDQIPMQEAALLLQEVDGKQQPAGEQSSSGLPGLPQGLPGTSLPLVPRIRIEAQAFSAAQIQDAVRLGAADAGVLLIEGSTGGNQQGRQPDLLQVVCREGEPLSENTAAELERRLRENRDNLLRGLLDQTRLGRAALPYVRRLSLASTAPAESPLAAFVPLMLVLMTMTGAVYPAIDLTAGERERGTLEMLMAAPVPPQHILLGKFAAVFLVAVMTALVNLTGMMLTLYGTGFDRVLLSGGAGPLMLAQVLLMLVVFAAFFSAVLLSVTSFARSFREAQAWLIPLMLVSLAPGILSLMPGVRLTFPLSLVPLVNIVLLGRELFRVLRRCRCLLPPSWPQPAGRRRRSPWQPASSAAMRCCSRPPHRSDLKMVDSSRKHSQRDLLLPAVLSCCRCSLLSQCPDIALWIRQIPRHSSCFPQRYSRGYSSGCR